MGLALFVFGMGWDPKVTIEVIEELWAYFEVPIYVFLGLEVALYVYGIISIYKVEVEMIMDAMVSFFAQLGWKDILILVLLSYVLKGDQALEMLVPYFQFIVNCVDEI